MLVDSDSLLDRLLELTDGELDDLLRTNELEQRRLVAERARLISAIERRHLWAAEHRSQAAYLRATLNCSSTTASRDLRRSRLLDAHPDLADAVAAGHIAPDHLDQIGRILANPRIRCVLPAVIGVLTDLAEHTSHREFADQVTRLIAQVDADGTLDDLRDAVDGRRATVVEAGGELFVSAHGGDAVQAARIQAVFDAFTEAEFRRDREHGTERTPAQRRFDALVAIFTAAHGAPEGQALPKTVVNIVVDAQTVHDTLTHAEIILPNRNTVVLDQEGRIDAIVHSPAEYLLADLMTDPGEFLGRHCETPSGSAIHPSVLLRALLTEHVRRVVIDSRKVVTDLGTTQRLFTGSARSAALLLEQSCVFPGCSVPADWSQVDHNVEHHLGGRTDQRNANAVCGHHNRLKHRSGWTTGRNERGRTYTLRRDGTMILPVGERPPDLHPDELIRRRCRALTAP